MQRPCEQQESGSPSDSRVAAATSLGDSPGAFGNGLLSQGA